MDTKNLIGLTGGIGCGKSTVLDIFSSLGCNTIDADAICHELYSELNGTVVNGVLRRWGKKILNLDGTVDRHKIAEIVFEDRKELEWLTKLIHPLIFEKAKKKYKNTDNLIIFDVPLLFEAGWENNFAMIITVWTTPEIQYKRLRRRGWTNTEIKARIKAQMNLDEKLEKADFGIINIGNFEFIIKQCKHILLEVNNYGI